MSTSSELPPLPDDWSRALAIAAHPDDLEYGTASAVAGWTAAGREVAYLLVTRGEAGIAGLDPATAAGVREEEERRGAAVVGVTDVRFLDHRAVGRAVLDAVDAAGNAWIFPELVAEGLEPWSVRRVAVSFSPFPTHAVDVTATRERGVASLSEHRAYLAALDDRPVEEQAREVVVGTDTGDDAPTRVTFEVFG